MKDAVKLRQVHTYQFRWLDPLTTAENSKLIKLYWNIHLSVVDCYNLQFAQCMERLNIKLNFKPGV